jgi:hypothetical protein
MVREAYSACGVADALMNKHLSRDRRDMYLRTYRIHHSRAQVLITQALKEFVEAGDRREQRDVLPIYHAAFLFHAAAVSHHQSLLYNEICSH